MTSISTPMPVSEQSRSTGRRIGWWLVPLLGLAAVAAGSFAVLGLGGSEGPAGGGTFHTVVPMDMDLRIKRRGELQAVHYTDIVSRVQGTQQIIKIVPEGESVQRGDELIRLDSLAIQQRKDDTDRDLRRAESNLLISQEMRGIQESQNAANREAAEVQLQLAQMELQQYTEGTYPQQLQNAKTARDMALTNLETREETLAQTRALYSRGFVTATDVQRAELDVTNARNEVQKTQTALNVLETYTHRMDVTRLRSNVAQAEQRLRRVLRENASTIAQRDADVREKEQSLADLQRRADHLQQQLDNCTILAPEDGLVIYASSVDRNMREQIQEGAQVRERQLLIRLPDVRSMKAVLRVDESQASRLDVSRNVRGTVTVMGRPIGATLTYKSVVADGGSRWWNPDLREYPVDLTLDYTPPGLKPGVSVEAEILVERLEQVLAVPLTAIYTVGRDSYVFVRSGANITHRPVRLGLVNESHAQIVSGLSEGDDVLMLQAGQGRALLEQAGVQVDNVRPGRQGRQGGQDGQGAPAENATPPGAGAANGAATGATPQPAADNGASESGTNAEQPAQPPAGDQPAAQPRGPRTGARPAAGQ